jgi:hypothetical protein
MIAVFGDDAISHACSSPTLIMRSQMKCSCGLAEFNDTIYIQKQYISGDGHGAGHSL